MYKVFDNIALQLRAHGTDRYNIFVKKSVRPDLLLSTQKIARQKKSSFENSSEKPDHKI